jgi:hypothetical protein
MASQYAYDQGGYTQRAYGEPEVMRAGAWRQAAPRRFVIRDHRGGWVIDID